MEMSQEMAWVIVSAIAVVTTGGESAEALAVLEQSLEDLGFDVRQQATEVALGEP